MLPDHHPRTSLIAAKTSSGVRSTVKVAVKSLLVMVLCLLLESCSCHRGGPLRRDDGVESVGAAPAVAADPVSSRVFRLARTAGHPIEIPWRTLLPGSKPSWTTVSFTTPCPASSMPKATLERGSARQASAVASS